MRILVTGGTGYLGRVFVSLCAKEHELVLLSRHSAIQADLSDLTSLQKAKTKVGKVDAIAHLAALVPKKSDEDLSQTMADANVMGTVNLLETFGKDVQSIVYASSVEVYGAISKLGPIQETALPQPSTYYGASKLAGEHFCNVFSLRQKVPITNLRFSVMFGSRDPISRAIPNFIRSALKNHTIEVYGGEELRDYLHVHDAAKSVLCALEAKKSGTYNVGSGTAISVKEAARKIIELTRSKSDLNVMPRRKVSFDLDLDIGRIQNDLAFNAKYPFPLGIEEQIESERSS